MVPPPRPECGRDQHDLPPGRDRDRRRGARRDLPEHDRVGPDRSPLERPGRARRGGRLIRPARRGRRRHPGLRCRPGVSAPSSRPSTTWSCWPGCSRSRARHRRPADAAARHGPVRRAGSRGRTRNRDVGTPSGSPRRASRSRQERPHPARRRYPRGMASAASRALLGEPLRSDRLDETLLPKRLALPVFCSDPLSSVAYATEQILLVLGLGGLALLDLTPWVAAAVVLLLVDRRRLLPADLRGLPERRRRLRGQPREPRRERVADRRLRAADRLRADGGGLGRRRRRGDHERRAGAGAARGRRCRSGSSSLLTLMNLRGVKESGRAFAIPTYGFVACDLRCCSRSASRKVAFGDGISAESADYQLRQVDRDRRAAARLPRPARLRLGLHGADRRRGGLQRRARPSRSRRAATPRRRW